MPIVSLGEHGGELIAGIREKLGTKLEAIVVDGSLSALTKLVSLFIGSFDVSCDHLNGGTDNVAGGGRLIDGAGECPLAGIFVGRRCAEDGDGGLGGGGELAQTRLAVVGSGGDGDDADDGGDEEDGGEAANGSFIYHFLSAVGRAR